MCDFVFVVQLHLLQQTHNDFALLNVSTSLLLQNRFVVLVDILQSLPQHGDGLQLAVRVQSGLRVRVVVELPRVVIGFVVPDEVGRGVLEYFDLRGRGGRSLVDVALGGKLLRVFLGMGDCCFGFLGLLAGFDPDILLGLHLTALLHQLLLTTVTIHPNPPYHHPKQRITPKQRQSHHSLHQKRISQRGNQQFQPYFEAMEKYIDSAASPEVAHIISMQSLLSEYDRENKQLSRQILELMEENKSLKMDKIKTNIINKYSDSRKDRKDKENGPRESIARNSSKQLVSRFKLQQADYKLNECSLRQQTLVKSIVHESDLPELKIERAKHISKSPYIRQKQLEVFSFGADTGRDSFKEEIEIQQTDIMVTPKRKLIYDTGIVITPPCPTNQNHQHNASRQSKRQDKDQTHKNGIILTNPALQCSKRSQKIEEQGKCELKKIRSCHSINPSPKLTPSSSEKKIGETPLRHQYEGKSNKTSSIKRSIMNISYKGIESFIRLQSLEKKKRYIDVVSQKRTPVRFKTDHY